MMTDKDFLPIQLRQIQLGLKEGIDVSIYAKPEYDWFQMEEIREGLKAGLDVSVYAKPQISYETMREIRKGMLSGIALASYMNLKPPVIRELRKARESKVNILKYVSQGYDAGQLRQIRHALEQGVDLEQYLSKDYRAASLEQMLIGLVHGVDVALYAKPFYRWRQMREIRKGLEHRIDVEKYSSQLYSWEQMKEVRLGLEQGLDVDSYRLLRYTAGEMRKKRLAILEAIHLEQEKILQSQIKAEDLMFEFTANDMEVYVTVLNKDKVITREKLLEILEQNYICKGIQEDVIDRIVSGREGKRAVLIAKGEIPRKGEDGWYEFFFRTDLKRKPKILEDGSADYHNIDWFEMVKEGQKLAYYHAALEGTDGYNVRGQIIKARKGIEQRILTGAGFRIDEDKKTYFAVVDGMITLEETEMRISNHMMLDEVTTATGDVHFDGSIHIMGDVKSGALVQASGDIVIDGNVEAARIESGGSVVLKKGMNSSGHGLIQAGKDVVSRFFESAKVEAKGNIEVDKSLNSQLYADGFITSTRAIAGGISQSGSGFRLGNVGNQAGLHTVLKLMVDSRVWEENRMIKSAIADVKNELQMLNKSYDEFKAKFPPEVRNAMEIFAKIEKAVYTKNKQLEQLKQVEEETEKKLRKVRDAKVIVSKQAFEGTVVELDGCRWEANDEFNVVIRRNRDQVEVLSK
ncbi:MAG: DUF342 domain-containing protein [Lachnospiraceae bacterium]|nr:DUF342 domain-containing protein [Lachnospiraceae bacterium]